MFARPVRSLTSSILVAVLGRVRVDEERPCARARAAALAEAPVGAGDGEARATRRRGAVPPAAPCQRAKSRSLSASASAVVAKRSGGFVDGSSISAFPLVTRRPDASAARKTASVCRTVPMSRIAVVPPAISSARPRRAESSSVSSSWAASPGPDVRREPRKEREVVGAVAEERLAEVDVRLDEAGEEPEAVRVEPLDGTRRRPRRRPRAVRASPWSARDAPSSAQSGAVLGDVVGRASSRSTRAFSTRRGVHSAEYRRRGPARVEARRGRGLRSGRRGSAGRARRAGRRPGRRRGRGGRRSEPARRGRGR